MIDGREADWKQERRILDNNGAWPFEGELEGIRIDDLEDFYCTPDRLCADRL
jgi:hypothetical protein